MMKHRLKSILESFQPKPAVLLDLPYPHVSLFSWRPSDGSVNFGDHLSKIIVQQMLATRGFSLDDEVAENARLLGIGSILHFAEDGNHVWGSGVNGKIADQSALRAKLTVHAVRGPLTRKKLQEAGQVVPEVYGDPGLLTATLFADRFAPAPSRDYVVVPNLHDMSLIQGQENMISPLWGWNRVVSEIMRAKFVVASSLHGLIIAEAFGIPAQYVRFSETENLFKYEDYFQGSGRSSGFTYATSVQDALDKGGWPAFRYDPAPLIAAFPWELWQAPARRG